MTIQQVYINTIEKFKKNHIDTPELDARLLISHILKIDQNNFIKNKDYKKINILQLYKLKRIIRKRMNGKSVASLINSKYFYDSEFYVNNNVLIPRPETELLIDIVKKKYDKERKLMILDIGTGSGNIAVILAKHYRYSKIDAIDISFKALNVASRNIKINKINKKRIRLIKTNIFNFRSDINYDIIISNPPYIDTFKAEDLLKDKIISDPLISLDGGEDGLVFYRRLKDIALNNLAIDGWMIVEHGMGQRDKIIDIFKNKRFYIEVYNDLSNIDRVIAVKKLRD